MKDFLKQKGIRIDNEIYSSDGRKYSLSELLTDYAKSLQLLQTDVSSSYSKKYAFEQIEQMLIEKLADFLDQEDVIIHETMAKLKDPVKREESFLHIRMAQSAMSEYKLTMLGI